MDCVERGFLGNRIIVSPVVKDECGVLFTVLSAEHYFRGGTCAGFDEVVGCFGGCCIGGVFVIGVGGDGEFVRGGEPRAAVRGEFG